MISIIIPAYNVESYIEECLQSILDQSYEQFHVVVVSDGSTDRTDAIVSDFSAKDDRIQLLKKEHENAGVARNAGIELAQGEYLLFFDADDIMESDMLRIMVERAQCTDADVTVCRISTFTEEGALEEDFGPFHVDLERVYSGAQLGADLFSSMVGWPWDKLFKASFIADTGLRFQSLSSTNDAFFVYMALVHAKKITFVPEKLVRHRWRSGSIETTRHKSPDNAFKAYEAICTALSELPQRNPIIEQACFNWGLSHTRWNFTTIEGEARAVAFKRYQSLLLSAATEGRNISSKADQKALEALTCPADKRDQLLVEQAIALFEARAEADSLRSQNEKDDGAIASLKETITMQDTHNRKLMEDIESLRETAQILEEEIDWLKGSTAYRVGNALTKLPRAIKEAVVCT